MKQALILGNIITMDEKRPFAKAALVKDGVFALKKSLRIILCIIAVFSFTMIFSGTDVFAATKPSVPERVAFSCGNTNSFIVSPNGWTVVSTKAKSSKKAVASVKTTDDEIFIEGKKPGKATIKTTVKAKNGKKTKTFSFQTKVEILAEDIKVSLDDIAAANKYDKLLEKYSNYNLIITPGVDGYDKVSYKNYEYYFFPEEMYTVREYSSSMYAYGYDTLTDDYYKYVMNEEESAYDYYVWYVMSDAERDALRTEMYLMPSMGGVVEFDEKYNEEIDSIGYIDGLLCLRTGMPFNNDFFGFANVPDEWNKAVLETWYYIDPVSLEVSSIYIYVNDGSRRYALSSRHAAGNAEVPSYCNSLREYAEYIQKGDYTNPKKITIVYDYGTEKEEKYTRTLSDDIYAAYVLKDGYDLFFDKEGTKPFERPDELPAELLLYALPTSENP